VAVTPLRATIQPSALPLTPISPGDPNALGHKPYSTPGVPGNVHQLLTPPFNKIADREDERPAKRPRLGTTSSNVTNVPDLESATPVLISTPLPAVFNSSLIDTSQHVASETAPACSSKNETGRSEIDYEKEILDYHNDAADYNYSGEDVAMGLLGIKVESLNDDVCFGMVSVTCDGRVVLISADFMRSDRNTLQSFYRNSSPPATEQSQKI
jgi:hypothetical protein